MKLFKVVYVKDTKDDWYLTSGENNMTVDDIMERELKEKWDETESGLIQNITVTEISEIDNCSVCLIPKKKNSTGYKKLMNGKVVL